MKLVLFACIAGGEGLTLVRVSSMEFITLRPGRECRLIEINRRAVAECSRIDAAVAYASNPSHSLFAESLKARKPLFLCGRYDSSLPISPSVMKWFIERDSSRYKLTFITTGFHPKVVWWRGYGVYIGSANLTLAAWDYNIESGFYVPEAEISGLNLRDPLESFFTLVRDKGQDLSREVYEQALEFERFLRKQGSDREAEFEKRRLLPKDRTAHDVTGRTKAEERRSEFLREWSNSLELLRGIGTRIAGLGRLPPGVGPGTAKGLLADRFLHEYYVREVLRGNSSTHKERHEENARDPEVALDRAIADWSRRPPEPFSLEVFNVHGPKLRGILSHDRLAQLTLNDMVEVCRGVHAIRDHAARLGFDQLGAEAPEGGGSSQDRADALAAFLFEERNGQGWGVGEVLTNLLYGEEPVNLPERIARLAFDPEYTFPRLKLSSLGELPGWAFPDDFPIRNNRTNKALYALGYEVAVWDDKTGD